MSFTMDGVAGARIGHYRWVIAALLFWIVILLIRRP